MIPVASAIDGIDLIAVVARELTLFAAVGILIGGIDDLLVDLIWIGREGWRRLTVYRRHARGSVATLASPERPGRIAVFIAAWDESAVIGQMLDTALARLDHPDYRIYVGCYPNDRATRAILAATAAIDPRVRPVLGPLPGPTTKADCLNSVWAAMCEDERRDNVTVKAIVLHDAEDVVHPAELKVIDRLIERFELVQLPVLPLADPASPWIAGHYLDEFAESHGKALVVREALGASVPSAGVGCGIARHVLAGMAAGRAGPFDADSLTEDYELGLRLAEAGGRGAFVRLPAIDGRRGVVAIRAYFPGTLHEAVRQKSRWISGIALSGWDRLGWSGGLAERWMRLRDRRAILSALVIFAAYTALALQAVLLGLLAVTDRPYPVLSTGMEALLAANLALLGWRLLMRAAFVTGAYGPIEGLRAIPRMAVANVVAVLAAWRAVWRYAASRRGGVVWDKTRHAFPACPPE